MATGIGLSIWYSIQFRDCTLQIRFISLFLSGFLIGAGWLGVNVHHQLEQRLPDCVRGSDVSLTGIVVESSSANSLVAMQRPPVRLVVAVQSSRACEDLTGRRIRLSWQHPDAITAGELWRLTVRIKPPWGMQNPGGFDYERWLLAKSLSGTGYVKTAKRIREAPPSNFRRLRAWVSERVQSSSLSRANIVSALLIGETGGISDEQWALFRSTSTVHLMVISGLHVGLAATLGFWIGKIVLRGMVLLESFIPLGMGASFTANTAGLLGSACFVCVYVWLSGFGVPATRALVMSLFGMFWFCSGRRLQPLTGLGLALVVVTICQPLAFLEGGFWLSFGAVALLMAFFSPRIRRQTRFKEVFQVQLPLAVGLLPVLSLTDTVPLAGSLINALVVPLMSLLVVPCLMLGIAVHGVSVTTGVALLQSGDWLLGVVLQLLQAWQAGPVLATGGLPVWHKLAVATAVLVLLVPQAWRGLLIGSFAWLLWSLSPNQPVPFGEFRITALDVGQGDAVIVDTNQHRLLFDTGARFPSGFSLGEAVVVPSMHATGTHRVDMLVLSHGDIDHTGGAPAVLKALEVREVRFGAGIDVRDELGAIPSAQPCVAKYRWSWDGVNFEFLHPPTAPMTTLNDNSGSCVLLISNDVGSALLTGDITEAVERSLLKQKSSTKGNEGLLLQPVNLLLAPHHGSRTSSSMSFVRRLRPEFLLVGAANRSRYGHPHPDVVQRYQTVGTRVFVTGQQGALSWLSHEPEQVRQWRLEQGRYWASQRLRPVSN